MYGKKDADAEQSYCEQIQLPLISRNGGGSGGGDGSCSGGDDGGGDDGGGDGCGGSGGGGSTMVTISC